MNLTNGLVMNSPIFELGAIMYTVQYRGNIKASFASCNAWPTMFFRRKPGKPSYQIAANSCCTFGWAMN